METILITGGTGFIGSYLAQFLKKRGYTVALLSRSGKHSDEYPIYYWDIQKQIIDPKAILTADHIIHLAGENIGDKRWSDERKTDIMNSRILPSRLLYDALSKTQHRPKSFISASATGYYGAITTEHIYTEEDAPANDFLGNTCRQWEKEADLFAESGIRTVKLRTGLVLAKNGGALEKLKKPVTLGLATPLGSGKQYMPWIHIDDLCNIYLQSITDTAMAGAFNAVAPEHITNAVFMQTLAKRLNKPFWPAHLPGKLLKLALGEMAEMLLEGSPVASDKLLQTGYRHQFPTLHEALTDLL